MGCKMDMPTCGNEKKIAAFRRTRDDIKIGYEEIPARHSKKEKEMMNSPLFMR
jgi:hypothetical protein